MVLQAETQNASLPKCAALCNIEEGELFGLLGPNRAGKTTTTRMLTTLLIPTSGSASVKGFDVVAHADPVRRCIDFIFGGERGLYWRLSGIDNLRYFASLYSLDPDVTKKRIDFLLDMVGLNGRARQQEGAGLFTWHEATPAFRAHAAPQPRCSLP